MGIIAVLRRVARVTRVFLAVLILALVFVPVIDLSCCRCSYY